MGEIQAPHQFDDAKGFQSVKVYDLIAFGNRTWQVTGVHLGATGHEDLATIVATDRKPGSVYGEVANECIVPLEFLAGRVFRYLKPNQESGQ